VYTKFEVSVFTHCEDMKGVDRSYEDIASQISVIFGIYSITE